MKRILIAAPKSGSGKTFLTCALLQALKDAGKKSAAFKCGPDYIDPMFHKKVIGVPSKNLDSYFTDAKTTRQLFLESAEGADIAVIEGVMGLYDGLGGIRREASSYDIAAITQTPIILVVDAHGMGASLIALLAGFLAYDTEHLMKGVILNKTTEMFYQLIKPEIEEKTGLNVLGYFPKQPENKMQSRHLGLVMPEEIPQFQADLKEAAAILKKSISLEKLFQIAEAEDIQKETISVKTLNQKVKIGVALDEAACFYYDDNLNLLRKMGAEICPFSLLRDRALPEGISGLLLGGGYPELHVKELSENISMKKAIKTAISGGMPSLAECGGFLYLHDYMEDMSSEKYPMAGVIEGSSHYTGKLVRFGYVEVQFSDGARIRGHEFHYYDSTNNGTDANAKKPVGTRNWACMHVTEDNIWGFPHLYYYSNQKLVFRFLSRCSRYHALQLSNTSILESR